MGLMDFLRAVLALTITLGLIGLAAWGVRRYAPGLLARLQGMQGQRRRRLEVLESLVLDPSRRLLLVRVDEEERVLLLGEGRELVPPLPPRNSAG